MSEATVEQLEQIEAMFVQVAHGMTTTDSSITLHGQAPSTLFFADRPQRVVGRRNLGGRLVSLFPALGHHLAHHV